MMGRLEDWLRVQTERDGIVADPGALPWSGVAVFKRAVRGVPGAWPAGAAAGRGDPPSLHWSELIGGDVVITLPAVWQRRFNASSVEVRPRMDDPVDPAIVDELPGALPGLRPRVRAGWPDTRRSSTRSGRPRGRCARSSGRTTSCSTRSATRSSRTRTSPPRDLAARHVTEVAAACIRPAGTLADGRMVGRAHARSRPAGGSSGCAWRRCGRASSLAFDTGPDEVAVLSARRRIRASTVDGEAHRLAGRTSVWAGPTRFRLRAAGDARSRSAAPAGGRFAVADGPRRASVPGPLRAGRRRRRSSCAAPAPARARCATSPRRTRSTPTG